MSVFDGVKVRREPEFPLHSGGTSPVLFDVPAMLGTKADRDYLSNLLTGRILKFDFNTIVGIEFGGSLLALLLVESFRQSKVDIGFYRKDGSLVMPGAARRCILVDDVVTTGSSLNEVQRALEAAGHTVVQAVWVVDRR